MIVASGRVEPAELERATGWHVETEGLCRDGVCVPFRADGAGALDARAVGDVLGMPLAWDAGSGLAALGSVSGGRALTSAVAPELELPDLAGRPFRLSSLRGQKVLLVAWAPW